MFEALTWRSHRLWGLRKGAIQLEAIIMESDMPDGQVPGEYFVSDMVSSKAWKQHQVEPLQMAAVLQISVPQHWMW